MPNTPAWIIFAYILAKIYSLRRISTLALRQRKAALLRRLAIPPDFLRASYVERFTTCGKANCACARGQKHGPFYYLASGLVPGRVLNGSPGLQIQPHRADPHDGTDGNHNARAAGG